MRPIKLMSPGRAVITESPLGHALRLSNHDNHVRHFKKLAKESLGGQTPRRIKLEEAEKRGRREMQWCCLRGFQEQTAFNCVASPFARRRVLTMFPYYPRHVAVLTETIKKGIHDADSEARSIARK